MSAGRGELDRFSGGDNTVTFGSLVVELARFASDFQRNPRGRGGIRTQTKIWEIEIRDFLIPDSN